MRAAPILFGCLFAAQAAFLTLAPILPDVAAEFDVSIATAGQLGTAGGLCGGVTATAIALLGRRMAVRPLLLAGLGLIAGGSVASALAPAFAVLLAAQFLLGAGMAAVLSGGVAAVHVWAPEGQRAKVLAWALLGQPASWVAGMPLIGLVADRGWRLAWVAVPFAASLLAFTAVWRRDRTERRAEAPRPRSGGRSIWRRRDVTGWAIGELLAYTSWNGTLIFAGALLIESYGISLGTTGLLLGGSALAYFPATLLARRHVDAHARPMLVALGLCAAVDLALLGALRPDPAVSLVLLVGLMALLGPRGLAGSAYGLQLAPERRVQVTGIRAAATQFGGLLGAAIGGAALAAGGWSGFGVALALGFALATVPHLMRVSPLHRLAEVR